MAAPGTQFAFKVCLKLLAPTINDRQAVVAALPKATPICSALLALAIFYDQAHCLLQVLQIALAVLLHTHFVLSP